MQENQNSKNNSAKLNKNYKSDRRSGKPIQMIEFQHPQQPQDHENGSDQYVKMPYEVISNSQSKSFILTNRLNMQEELQKQNSLESRKLRPQRSLAYRGSDFQYFLNVRRIIKNFIKVTAKNTSIIKFLNVGDLNQAEKLLESKLLGKSSQLGNRQLPVFGLQSQFILIWDIFISLVILLTCILYPFILSFASGPYVFQSVFQISIILIFVADVAINFNRAQVKRGVIVKERSKIKRIYLQHGFVRDMTALLCSLMKFFIQLQLVQIISTASYILLIFPKSRKIHSDMIQYYNIKGNLRDFISLVEMLFSAFYVVHFIACIWHGIANFSGYQQTWLTYYELTQKSVRYKYLVSFYWAAMTMTTVGYGDITPKNESEYIAANATMLFSCIFFAYTMNRIGTLLTSINQRDQDQKQNLAVINSYMVKNKIGLELQRRVRSYLNYVLKAEFEENINEIQHIIGKLPIQLQEELEFSLKGKILEKCSALNHFSKELVRRTSQILQPIRCTPEETIQNCDDSLYLLQSGDVRIQPDGCNFNFKIDMFGEGQFFTGQRMKTNPICHKFSTLFKVPRNKFLELLDYSDSDKEKYHYIKDQILFGSRSLTYIQRCPVCQSNQHQFENCNLVFIKINKDTILKRHIYPHFNERKKFKRDLSHKHQTLKLSDQSQQTLKILFQRLNDDEDFMITSHTPDAKSQPGSFQNDPSHPSYRNIILRSDTVDEVAWSCREFQMGENHGLNPNPAESSQQKLYSQTNVLPSVLVNERADFEEKTKDIRTSIRNLDNQKLYMIDILRNRSQGSIHSSQQMQTHGKPEFKHNLSKVMNVTEDKVNKSFGYFWQNSKQGHFDKQFGIPGFERMQVYSIFYPDGNYEAIIRKYLDYLLMSKQGIKVQETPTIEIYVRLLNWSDFRLGEQKTQLNCEQQILLQFELTLFFVKQLIRKQKNFYLFQLNQDQFY